MSLREVGPDRSHDIAPALNETRVTAMHPSNAYHTCLPAPPPDGWAAVAAVVHAQGLRTTFDAPGFALITLTEPIDSHALRFAMIALKSALDGVHFTRFGQRLVYQSMARFDQQNTTKFHLDSGPDESLLMLGYEPTTVVSTIALADFTLASHRLGITPADFLREHNPMYTTNRAMIEPFITTLTPFDVRLAQILIINNSKLGYDMNANYQLGVLHQAEIPSPDAAKRRVINSTMIRIAPSLAGESHTPSEQREFAETTHISGAAGY